MRAAQVLAGRLQRPRIGLVQVHRADPRVAAAAPAGREVAVAGARDRRPARPGRRQVFGQQGGGGVDTIPGEQARAADVATCEDRSRRIQREPGIQQASGRRRRDRCVPPKTRHLLRDSLLERRPIRAAQVAFAAARALEVGHGHASPARRGAPRPPPVPGRPGPGRVGAAAGPAPRRTDPWPASPATRAARHAPASSASASGRRLCTQVHGRHPATCRRVAGWAPRNSTRAPSRLANAPPRSTDSPSVRAAVSSSRVAGLAHAWILRPVRCAF